MNNKKYKILHIHVLPVISGSGINTFLTMNGLKNKYEMEMACAPGKDLNDMVIENGMRVHEIKNFVSEAKPLKDIHALWQLYKLLKTEKYDLVHTHNSKGGFLGRLAAKLAGVPHVIHTVHGFAFHNNETFIRRTLFYFLEKMVHNWCDAYICISKPLVDLWIKHKLAPKEKITKIYSGIEISEFASKDKREKIRNELGIKDNEIAIGQVSKLWEGKGHIDIINAVPMIIKKHTNCKFFFIGDGPIRKKLELEIKKRNLEHKIFITGHRNDIPQITSALDIAVLASYYEGMGRVILEAMATGLPVVATSVGGIVDLIDNAQTGILVKPHSPKQLAQAIIKLIKDSNLRTKMGQAGVKKIDKHFSSQTMIKEIDKLYMNILNKNLAQS